MGLGGRTLEHRDIKRTFDEQQWISFAIVSCTYDWSGDVWQGHYKPSYLLEPNYQLNTITGIKACPWKIHSIRFSIIKQRLIKHRWIKASMYSKVSLAGILCHRTVHIAFRITSTRKTHLVCAYRLIGACTLYRIVVCMYIVLSLCTWQDINRFAWGGFKWWARNHKHAPQINRIFTRTFKHSSKYRTKTFHPYFINVLPYIIAWHLKD